VFHAAIGGASTHAALVALGAAYAEQIRGLMPVNKLAALARTRLSGAISPAPDRPCARGRQTLR